MKKFKKLLCVLVGLVLMLSILSACGTKDVKVGGKYTYWVTMTSTESATLTSFNDMLMFQEIAKRTGTEVDFIHPAAGSTGTEAFQILLSSGDYPDMIEYTWTSYAGGPDQAIADGVIIALNDYMEDYAPNYYDFMEGEKGRENGMLYKAQAMTDKGNYYGFNNLNIGIYRGFSGLYVRKDMLDKWGLKVPKTIDDWDMVLKTAKENGFKYPLTGMNNLFSFSDQNMFNGAWNVGKGFYLDGDTVKFGPFETAYKDYLKKMIEWTKNGYVDIDYVTNDRTNVEGYMTNGTSIASFGYVGSGLGKLLPAMEEKDPNYSVVACPYPVMKLGDTPWFQEVQAEAGTAAIGITVQCGSENPDRYKEAISWCDYIYSEEGTILKCFGIEGDTFTIEKGEDGKDHYIYTDKIYDHEKIGAHDVGSALYHFMRPANSPGLNQHEDYLKGFYPYEEQIEAMDVWNTWVDAAKEHKFPSVTYTGEEASKKAQIEASGKDNLEAAISNYILGKISEADYDKAVEAAKAAGYEELLKIQQTAYNRYLEIIK